MAKKVIEVISHLIIFLGEKKMDYGDQQTLKREKKAEVKLLGKAQGLLQLCESSFHG